jgi:hypothetical protein
MRIFSLFFYEDKAGVGCDMCDECHLVHSQGRRNRGRPKETWRRMVEKEMKQLGLTWGKIFSDRLPTEEGED